MKLLLVQLSHSMNRLARVFSLPRGTAWQDFLRKEAWLHLKLSLRLWWTVLRRKGG